MTRAEILAMFDPAHMRAANLTPDEIAHREREFDERTGSYRPLESVCGSCGCKTFGASLCRICAAMDSDRDTPYGVRW